MVAITLRVVVAGNDGHVGDNGDDAGSDGDNCGCDVAMAIRL